MARVYTATFAGVSVSGVADLFEIVAPATAVVCIHEVHITQDTSETSEMLPVAIIRVPPTTGSGSGGGTNTPRKMLPGDAAAASTVETCNSTVATTSTTLENLRRLAENVLNGWHWVLTPETRLWIPPSGMVVVRLMTAPTAALTMSGELVFEEIG